ncbi:hypothetical protein KKF04_02300, partial [Patescibacteria group bacterium]|nr:hypothetical protein [Patescibacteria group bacterium]
IGKGIKFAHKYVSSPIYEGVKKKPTTPWAAKDVFWKTTKQTVTGKKEKSKLEKLMEMGWSEKDAKKIILEAEEKKEKKEKEKEKKAEEEKEKKEKEEKEKEEKENKT